MTVPVARAESIDQRAGFTLERDHPQMPVYGKLLTSQKTGQ